MRDVASGVAAALRDLDGSDRRFGLASGASVLAFLLFVGILYPAPLPILFLGVVLGSLSALMALGIVLIYRANRIVNFAQGDMGGLAAVLSASLIVGPKWPFFPAVIVGFLTAMVLGWITEVTVIRRFAKAPRLILTVATIGLFQIFAAGELILPQAFDYDVAPQPPQPFSFTFEWFPVVFSAGHLLILAVVPAVVVGLTVFFRRSDVGVAVRAAAESADRASLLGIPVKRINTLVWVLAAGLSGLSVLLRMPIQGVSIGAVLGPSLLLRALAAAVIGRMESLPVTFGAALVLGMVEQAVLFETGRTIIVDAVLFFIILAALLVRRRRATQSRADDTGASTWQAIREVRPIPRELRDVPLVKGAVQGLAIGLGLFLFLAPLRFSPGSVNLLGGGLIIAMVITSLMVLTGWAGQISLGHLAFVAFGAATAGTLAQQGKPFLLTLAVAGFVGAGVAMVIGVPALRIRGLFLAVTTLAFALTTGTFFINDEFFPWFVPDRAERIVRPVLLGKFDLESEHTFYYVVLAAALLVWGSVRSLRRSRTGRALIGVRDNTRTAQSFGISPTRAQLTAFALSGFVAAFAGGIFVFHQHGLSGTVLETEPSLRVFSIAVIGGLGSPLGAVLGAGYLTAIDSATSVPELRLLASGAGVLLVLLAFPGGLGGLAYELRDRVLRVIARRKGIVVPSLLADVRVDADVVPSGGEGDRTTPLPVAPAAVPRPSHAALLDVRGLDVAYGRTQVLFDVDFTVGGEEIVALLGTNGAGKSTLLNAISGLVEPSRGSVTFDGQDVTRESPQRTAARGIVLMPGTKGVFPTLTVAENLRLAGWLYRKEPEHVRLATERVLTSFPILRERWDEKAGNLSGGEQQMLTLGQVLISRPRLLMIDELSLGLAPRIVEQLLGIVREIHAQGTAVILVEQSVNIAVTLAERAVFLEKGEVRFQGPTARLLDRPDILRAVFLQGAAAGGDGQARPAVILDKPEFVPHCGVCGREHGVVLRVDQLAARFGGVLAVRDVSFDVRESQITGIIGPNGAGKTTVFDVVSGFVPVAAGRVHLLDEDVTSLSPDERAMRGLGRSFQDARLFPSMTVRETIGVALERHIRVRDPIAAALMSPAVKVSEARVSAEVDRLIELMNLQAYADKFVGELSTGTRRVVDLACAIAHDPKVLLLDEPSSGLAQRETEAMGPVLLDLREKTGAALVVVEHDIPLVTAVADELVALDLGAVVARGRPEEVIDHPAVVEGYLGGTEEVIRRSGSSRDRAAPAKSRGTRRTRARRSPS